MARKATSPRRNPALGDYATQTARSAIRILKTNDPASLVVLHEELEQAIRAAAFPEMKVSISLAAERLTFDEWDKDTVIYTCPWCDKSEVNFVAVMIDEEWTAADELQSIEHQGKTVQFDVNGRYPSHELLYLRCSRAECSKPVSVPAGFTIEFN